MGTPDAAGETFWGWPGWKNLAYAYLVLGPPLFVCFVLIFGGADYLTGLHNYRAPLYFPFELAIPLVPGMVLVYNTLHVAYSIAPFILRTRPEMNAMAATWVLITLAGGVVFLIIPFEVGFPVPSDAELGVWRSLYRLADDANLQFNTCPSLHVAWSIVCVDVYATKAGRLLKLLLWLWGTAMMLSTVLLHFHHLVDVAGGFGLAMVGSRLLYPRLWARFRPQAT
jgi:membrane-associated phospholipid phosphatase